jgi:hypothetical protein
MGEFEVAVGGRDFTAAIGHLFDATLRHPERYFWPITGIQCDDNDLMQGRDQIGETFRR